MSIRFFRMYGQKFMLQEEFAKMLCVPSRSLNYWRHIGLEDHCFTDSKHILFCVGSALRWIAQKQRAGKCLNINLEQVKEHFSEEFLSMQKVRYSHKWTGK